MAGVKTEIQLALTNKKLDQLETDYEQQSSKLTTTIEKLEETANAAAECDRYAGKRICLTLISRTLNIYLVALLVASKNRFQGLIERRFLGSP